MKMTFLLIGRKGAGNTPDSYSAVVMDVLLVIPSATCVSLTTAPKLNMPCKQNIHEHLCSTNDPFQIFFQLKNSNGANSVHKKPTQI